MWDITSPHLSYILHVFETQDKRPTASDSVFRNFVILILRESCPKMPYTRTVVSGCFPKFIFKENLKIFHILKYLASSFRPL